jgi:hypothetical protein
MDTTGESLLPTLTVKQPYADLIVRGIKTIENRSWTTSYRGRLGIHAAVSDSRDGWAKVQERGIDLDPEDVERGALIGIVELADVVRDSRDEWALEGHAHWVLSEPQRLPAALPVTGRLSLWAFDLSAEALVQSVCANCVAEVLAWDDVRDRWVCAGCGGDVA